MFSPLKNSLFRLLKRREMKKKGYLSARRKFPRNLRTVHFFERSWTIKIILAMLIWVVSVCTVIMPASQGVLPKLVEKQIAFKSIFADFDFSYEDTDKTFESKEAARKAVPLYYRIRNDITEQTLKDIQKLFDELQRRNSLEKKGIAYTATHGSKSSAIAAKLEKETLEELVRIIENPRQNRHFFDELDKVLENGITTPADKKNLSWLTEIRIIDSKERIRAPKLLRDMITPEEACRDLSDTALKYYSYQDVNLLKKAFSQMLEEVICDGNLEYDASFTEQRRAEAAAAVRPVMIDVKKGEPLITKNSEVTKRDLKLLEIYYKELDQRTASSNFWSNFTGSSLLCLTLIAVFWLYLKTFSPEIFESNRRLWLLGIVIAITLGLDYGFVEIFNVAGEHLNIHPELLPGTLPLAVSAVLIVTLFDLQTALASAIFIASVTALMLGYSFNTMLLWIFVSTVTAFSVKNALNYRSFSVLTVISVFISVMFMDLIFFRTMYEIPGFLNWLMILALANGFLTAVISLILVFFFESVFNVSTNMSLLLLCDHNHPLLKRLQFEAPGTYHHSLMVSTLAEQAAREIGANPIKARVGAYFHDIGKLTKPEYFSENNLGTESRHKELPPRMSSLIILNHVKDGIDLAIKYKLKRLIRDAIEQHHGSDMVFYFYKRALEENREKNYPVLEEEYRYPGPLPQDKEIVLISLADACEAASRSITKPTHAKIDALVWEIFRKRIKDGQLDNADMSFREIARVRSSFVKTLVTMLHVRVQYPKDDDDNDEDDEIQMESENRQAQQKDA